MSIEGELLRALMQRSVRFVEIEEGADGSALGSQSSGQRRLSDLSGADQAHHREACEELGDPGEKVRSADHARNPPGYSGGCLPIFTSRDEAGFTWGCR